MVISTGFNGFVYKHGMQFGFGMTSNTNSLYCFLFSNPDRSPSKRLIIDDTLAPLRERVPVIFYSNGAS